MSKIDKFLQDIASKPGISDVHFEEGQKAYARINSVLSGQDLACSREDILAFLSAHAEETSIDVEQFQAAIKKTGDRDFALQCGKHRYRGNVYLTNGRKITLALRQLPATIPELSSLGLPAAYIPLIEKSSRGILIVAGATGSGKTTTLASTVHYLNQNRKGHIITLEDPIEYIHTSGKCLVHQRQVGPDASSFSHGLRAALRQDPDIIMVGEMRDHDTVRTALDASNTGHLVLATLHTNSAQQSVDRLVSFFPEESRAWAQNVLSQTLLAVVCQALLKKSSGAGLALASEFLLNTPDVRSSIREGKTHQIFNHMDTGGSKGQVLFNNSLLRLVRTHQVSLADAMMASPDPDRLRKEAENA